MQKISVLIAKKHATSISLEEEFVSALKHISGVQQKSLNDLITEIDRSRDKTNLSSAIRIFVLNYFQKANKNGTTEN